jgi:hypothetical protein
MMITDSPVLSLFPGGMAAGVAVVEGVGSGVDEGRAVGVSVGS